MNQISGGDEDDIPEEWKKAFAIFSEIHPGPEAKKYSHQYLMKSKLMAAGYLHNHKEFAALLNIVANERNILRALVEKD